MYIIFQYLHAVSKSIEIYIKAGLFWAFKPFKSLKALKSRPKLLLAAVILFGAFWSVFNAGAGLEQLVLNSNNQKQPDIKEELNDADLLNLGSPYLSAVNASAVFNSSAILASQIEPISAPQSEETEKENPLASVGETALLSSLGPAAFISQEPRTGLITYTVQPGDTASSIADFFGITTETLLWANNLKETSVIKPGDELTVLPISGVLHKVKSGQTVKWIADYYKAEIEDIMAFNDLPADGRIEVGEKLVVPGGEMPAPAQPKAQPKRIADQSYAGPGTGQSRKFPYGQCTWYVAQKRVIPWSGNAKDWLANAQAMGYPVCLGNNCEPKLGAIVSLRGDSWLIRLYGHVAYVEAVQDGWITVSEMNYAGWGVKSVRTLNQNSGLIKGYIY